MDLNLSSAIAAVAMLGLWSVPKAREEKPVQEPARIPAPFLLNDS